jgi:DedD protein
MARPISDEEIQLRRRARRRLIGAIVLVTALVVALPMVLDTEPRPTSGEISIKIPPPDSDKFTSRVVPVPPSAEPKPAPGGRPAGTGAATATPKFSAAIGEAAAPVPAKADPGPEPAAVAGPKAGGETPKAPSRSEAPPPAPSAPGNAGASEFAVQVVALADAQKVKQVREQIASAGLKSYTETVKTARGDVTRVRTGPYPTRAAAEKARDQLKAVGLSGNVVPK